MGAADRHRAVVGPHRRRRADEEQTAATKRRLHPVWRSGEVQKDAFKKVEASADIVVQAFASTSAEPGISSEKGGLRALDTQTSPRHGEGARPPQGSSRDAAATSSRTGASTAEWQRCRPAAPLDERHLPVGTPRSIRKGQTQEGSAGVILRTTITGSTRWRIKAATAATGRINSGEKREREGDAGGKPQGGEAPAATLIAAGWTSIGELRQRRGVGEEGADLLGVAAAPPESP